METTKQSKPANEAGLPEIKPRYKISYLDIVSESKQIKAKKYGERNVLRQQFEREQPTLCHRLRCYCVTASVDKMDEDYLWHLSLSVWKAFRNCLGAVPTVEEHHLRSAVTIQVAQLFAGTPPEKLTPGYQDTAYWTVHYLLSRYFMSYNQPSNGRINASALLAMLINGLDYAQANARSNGVAGTGGPGTTGVEGGRV